MEDVIPNPSLISVGHSYTCEMGPRSGLYRYLVAAILVSFPAFHHVQLLSQYKLLHAILVANNNR